MRRTALLLLIGLAWAGVDAAAAAAEDLTVSVAISMKDAVEEVGRRFRGIRPEVALRFNIGASGNLQKQIEAGAPVDVFVSAAERQMDELERRGLLVAGSRRTFARNALSVVIPSDSRLTITTASALLGPAVQRIAIGNPKTVPAGQYAEESLRRLGLWDGLRGRLVLGENVRHVLEYVARGEVEAGFVYATDVRVRARAVKEAFRPPPGSYGPVTYPAAIVAGTRHPDVGRDFLTFLMGREGHEVLARLGFQPLAELR